MKQHQYKIPRNYFISSPYATHLSNELDNDAEGLIFDRFIHDIGTQLNVDIVYKKTTKADDHWFLGENQHIEVLLDDFDEEHYLLTLTPLSVHGTELISNVQIDSTQH
jgi:hypothetical protein